ncbi:arsenic resistance protein [Halobaculum sp. MBLA0143]|uniref:arsenic resistance protein n=1 Tax=Halobaculum sp. MBLA0143 TaxID=3079933 RepID=UPI0035269257
MIRRLLTGLKNRLVYVVVGSLASGLAAGQLLADPRALRAAVVPILFVMVYPMLVNVSLREVLAVREHAAPVGGSLSMNFLFTPVLAVGLARLFFDGSPGYAVGLYFVALVPTSGMTAAWTGLADGDLEAAVVATAVNLLVAVAVLPVYLSVLVPGSVTFQPDRLYAQLARVIVAPMVVAVVTRWVLLRRLGQEGFERVKPLFGGVSTLGVAAIVLVATAMRSTAILADPIASASVVVPLVAFYAVVFAVGSGLGRLLGPARGTALVYATSMRNLSVALAVIVAADGLPATAVLPVALSYLLQPPLGAISVRFRRAAVHDGVTLREAVARLV